MIGQINGGKQDSKDINRVVYDKPQNIIGQYTEYHRVFEKSRRI